MSRRNPVDYFEFDAVIVVAIVTVNVDDRRPLGRRPSVGGCNVGLPAPAEDGAGHQSIDGCDSRRDRRANGGVENDIPMYL